MIFSRKIVVRPPLLCFFIIKPLYKAIKSLFKMMIEPFSQERNEATLVRSGITAFPYVLPLAGYFLSVADTLLLVLLVCFCHPSVVHLPLGRAITASLTLMLLSLVVPRLATSLVLVWCSILLGILLLMYCWWWIVFCLHVTIRMLLYCRTLCECSLATVFRHLNFLNEASHSYFFQPKVSASRILQVPAALFPEFFQKLFAVCTHPIKTFHCRWWNNSVIPCLTYFPC